MLIEKGAEEYELTLGLTRRPQDVSYRGPTLGDGRVGVKPSPIGGPGGRGLFAIKDLTTKEGILYGGEIINHEVARALRAAGRAQYIMQLMWPADSFRVDGRAVAEAVSAEPDETGWCTVLHICK